MILSRSRLGEVVEFEPAALPSTIDEPVALPAPASFAGPGTMNATAWIAAGVMLSGIAALILVLRGR